MIEPLHEREPPRVRLANLPTPGHRLRAGQNHPPRIRRPPARGRPRVRLPNLPPRGHWLRYGQTDRPRIWVKRDDQTGSELMGNKVRKLEYLMAEAVAPEATHVITCGGEQSNHARAT